MPRLEIVNVVLMHCKVVNSNSQKHQKILFTFEPDKQFGQLVTISPHSLTLLKSTNAECSFVKLWFTDQNN